MSELVNSLKAEHSNIIRMLEEVYELGVDTEEGHNRLMAAKNGLLAHLKREDEELYPALEKAALDDPQMNETLKIFKNDMSSVSVAALEFFAKNCLPSSVKEFALDYEHLAGILMKRIEREEAVIYKYYDQLDRKD